MYTLSWFVKSASCITMILNDHLTKEGDLTKDDAGNHLDLIRLSTMTDSFN